VTNPGGASGGTHGGITPISSAGPVSGGGRSTSGAGAGGSSSADLPAALDPSAALDPATGPLGRTGLEADLLAVAGGSLLAIGEIGRRSRRRRRGPS
jgi:hypothetical protein